MKTFIFGRWIVFFGILTFVGLVRNYLAVIEPAWISAIVSSIGLFVTLRFNSRLVSNAERSEKRAAEADRRLFTETVFKWVESYMKRMDDGKATEIDIARGLRRKFPNEQILILDAYDFYSSNYDFGPISTLIFLVRIHQSPLEGKYWPKPDEWAVSVTAKDLKCEIWQPSLMKN